MKGTLNHVPTTSDRDVIETQYKKGSNCDDRLQIACCKYWTDETIGVLLRKVSLNRWVFPSQSTHSLLFFIFLHFHSLFQVLGRCCSDLPMIGANSFSPQGVDQYQRVELLFRRELEGGRRSSAPNDLQKTITINTNCHRSPADIDRAGAGAVLWRARED